MSPSKIAPLEGTKRAFDFFTRSSMLNIWRKPPACRRDSSHSWHSSSKNAPPGAFLAESLTATITVAQQRIYTIMTSKRIHEEQEPPHPSYSSNGRCTSWYRSSHPHNTDMLTVSPISHATHAQHPWQLPFPTCNWRCVSAINRRTPRLFCWSEPVQLWPLFMRQ